jgi:hypothetical protein
MAKKRIPKAKEKPKAKEEVKTLPVDDDKPFDFGGLPQRDIKKNLGCG